MVIQAGYRSRTRGSYGAAADSRSCWYDSTQTPVYTVKTNPSSEGVVETMNDFVTPGFSALSKRGQIVNTYMSKTYKELHTTTSGPKFADSKSSTTVPKVIYYGDLQGPHWTAGKLTDISLPGSVPALSSITSLIDITRTRAMANVSQPDFEGLVSLGELRETLSLLRNPLKGALHLAEALDGSLKRKGIWNKRARSSSKKIRDELASLYLSFRYGIRPLMKETAAVLENLRQRPIPRPKRVTARAKEEVTENRDWVSNEAYGSATYIATYSYKRTVVIRAGVLYENVVEYGQGEKWGMRVTDIPSAAWELVPLSFVYDWFANIGDFVSAITPRAGIRQLATWYTVSVEETLTRSVSGYILTSNLNADTVRDGTGKDTVIKKTFYRVPDIGVPALALRSLDTLKNDVGRLTDLVSLFNQRLKVATPYEPKTALNLVRGRTVRNLYKGEFWLK